MDDYSCSEKQQLYEQLKEKLSAIKGMENISPDDFLESVVPIMVTNGLLFRSFPYGLNDT